MARTRKTRVKALEGRVIKSALIWPADHIDDNGHGPSLELRLSGGIYFTFTATAPLPKVLAVTLLADKEEGDLENIRERTFGDDGAEVPRG